MSNDIRDVSNTEQEHEHGPQDESAVMADESEPTEDDLDGQDDAVEPVSACIEDDDPEVCSSQKIEPPGSHVVVQGESAASVAALYGVPYDRLWDHPKNSDLKEQREGDALFPGDEVFIPADTKKQIQLCTGKRHRLVHVRPMVWIRLQLQDEQGEPREALRYRLRVEGEEKVHEGRLGKKRLFEHQVPATAQKAYLTIVSDVEGGQGQDTEVEEEEYELFLGHLDPSTEVSGALGRLNNLGYRVGRPQASSELDEQTKDEITQFQLDSGLTATGDLDDATMAAIVKMYGC